MQQEKLKNHPPLCLCEICDKEIKTRKQTSDKWSRQSSSNKNEAKRNIYKHEPSPKRSESITSPITQSKGEESFLEPPPPSDPGDDPEWEGSTEEPNNIISWEQYKMGIKDILWDGILTKKQGMIKVGALNPM